MWRAGAASRRRLLDVRELHVFPLRVISFVKANIAAHTQTIPTVGAYSRLTVARSQPPLADVEICIGDQRQCSTRVYAICVLLNSSLTKERPARPARQIFDPKFTIPHVPEGYD